MAAEIHELKTHRVASAQAIEKLEYALEQVRKGDVVAVAIATVRFDGSANSAFSAAENGVTMLGAINLLRYRYEHSLMQDDNA